MGHRQMFFPSQTSHMECADIWNHPYPDPHICLGTAAIGMHPMPYFDITLESNNLPSSNFSFEIPSHNNFPHPASASGSNPMPPNYIHGGPSCYNEFAINSHMDYERSAFKRKNPAIPMAFNRGNNNSYPGAGSSSNFPISSVNSQVNPAPGPQYWAWDSNSMPSAYMNNSMLVVSEGSQRNVRSRQSLALHLGNNQIGKHPPSSFPHHLYPATNISGMTAPGQWGHTPPPWILPSGAGSYCNYGGMEIDRGYPHNPLQNRVSNTQLPTTNGTPSQMVNVDHSSYEERINPYRTASTHQPLGLVAPLADGRGARTEAVALPRYSRPVPIIGQSSERNGRSRGLHDRFRPISYANNGQTGRVSDGRAFYDSRNLFDQHHDMRVDVDSMSYEELLALEERIGNVSTGLSGDDISRYIVEATYCAPNQVQDNEEEKTCVICLDVYKEKESVGSLACRHDFHSHCIKKWLSIKNACPICKASALPDTSKEK